MAQKVGLARSVFCTAERKTAILLDMEPPEALQQRVRHEQQLITRLRLAVTRLADAERERIWAIVAAKEAGLSIRQIARATDVSPTRIPQLLQADDAHEIPVWLSRLREQHSAPSGQPEGALPNPAPSGQTRVADEAEVLRWCIAWLERLEHADHVVVHLRPASEEQTEFVPFDRPRVVRVLARIAADLDEFAHRFLAQTAEVVDDQEARRARHRQRLAEPELPPRRLSRWEERAASRHALDSHRLRRAKRCRHQLFTKLNALARLSTPLLLTPQHALVLSHKATRTLLRQAMCLTLPSPLGGPQRDSGPSGVSGPGTRGQLQESWPARMDRCNESWPEMPLIAVLRA